jgi:hypothetical protein
MAKKRSKVDLEQKQLEFVAWAILEKLQEMAKAARTAKAGKAGKPGRKGRGNPVAIIRPCFPSPTASFCPSPPGPFPWGKNVEFVIEARKIFP